MTVAARRASSADDDALGVAILAVPGVRGLYADSPLATAAMLLGPGRGTESRRVGLITDSDGSVVSVRIAVDAAVPSRQVLEGIRAVVRALVPGEVRLTVEIAHFA